MSPDLKNKVCIVTGANSGIGKITAREIAKMGAEVILVCRNKKKGEEALSEIVMESKNNNVHLMLCDFSSQKSIRNFAEEFKSKYDRLDILVNNAGLFISDKSLTEDGIESTFAINHLGYFLLTNLLLDLLKKSAPARIVNVSSEGHRMGHVDFDDINSDKSYKGLTVYCTSKLANILFTKELAKKLEGTGVTTNCLHPGGVSTNFTGDSSGWFRIAFLLARPFLITPEQGAATQIYLATSPEVANVTGEYFDKKRVKKPSKEARDPEVAKKLWNLSEKLTNLK